MAASNETKIVLTAEDRTSPALQSVTRGLQGIESQAMLASRALGAIGVTFSAAAAVAMVKGTIDAADGFNDLSQKVGISVRQLAGWTLAANQSGTSMESVAKGVKGLSTYVVEHGDKLRAAGITATDANGAMTQLADLFAAMPDGVQKTALAVQLFGKAGMDMIPMLNMGSQGLAEAQEKADAYGKKMAELAPDADKFNDQVEELALHMKALAINITSFVITPLTNMATAMNDIASGGARAEKQMAWLADQGHPIARAVMAWSGVFKGMGLGIDRSQGYTGPKNAAGLPASEEEQFSAATDAYLAQRKSSKAAAGLLDKSTAKTGKTDQQRMIELGQRNLAASTDSEEEQRILAEKRAMQEVKQEFESLQRMIKRGEENELARYYETAGEETMRLVAHERELKDATKDSFADMTRVVESWGNKAADTFADFVVDGKASFSDLVNSMLKDIARLQAKKILDPVTKGASDWLSGALGKGIEGIFGGGGGGGAAPEWNPEWSFAGGGFTGNGARTGGLDGQGGFMAMLHPRETVIDHAQGGSSAPPNVVVQVINQTGTQATAKQQGAPRFDGNQWVISAVMEAAATNPGFRAAMGIGR